MRYLALGFVVGSAMLVAGLSGCGGSDGGPELADYFAAQPYSNPACNVVDDRLAGQREMRLFVNGNVDLLPMTRGLASYYHRHSLSFFTGAEPQPTTMAYALDTDTAALTVDLIDAFPGVDLTDEQALMADPVLWNQIVTFVANWLLRPMVDFATEHGDVGTAVTNLVVVPDLERPGGEQVGDPGTSLVGLAISPALLAEFARSMPEESQIWQGVTFPAEFTPMMVLGDNVLKRVKSMAPNLFDLFPAHEFGHTAALIHTTVVGNLMFASAATGRDDCTNSLDDAQLAMMRATLNVGAAASGELLSGPDAAPAAGDASEAHREFSPAGLRDVLAGDRRALRPLIDRLFHARPRR